MCCVLEQYISIVSGRYIATQFDRSCYTILFTFILFCFSGAGLLMRYSFGYFQKNHSHVHASHQTTDSSIKRINMDSYMVWSELNYS